MGNLSFYFNFNVTCCTFVGSKNKCKFFKATPNDHVKFALQLKGN